MTDNEPAVTEAVYGGDVGRARELLKADPSLAHHKKAFLWLNHAARAKNVEMTQVLLGCGCDPNAIWKGWTGSLFSAVAEDCPEIVKLLLEHGANPNLGRAVLIAIMGEHQHSLELVKLLEKHGADMHKEFTFYDAGGNDTGARINALFVAEAGRPDVAEYLRSRGAVLPTQPPRQGA